MKSPQDRLRRKIRISCDRASFVATRLEDSVWLRRRQLAEALRPHVESVVELAGEVLKGDQPRQLDDRVVVEMRTQSGELLVGDDPV
jgi:hypothetical protein